jgi:gamma-glutamylcyclotransferase (GGCT)/AIG2-like uncharacterized protein YtfP
MTLTVLMFVNGQAMRGFELHHALGSARFVGPARTAPRYRFFAYGNSFPGIVAVDEGGWAVPGELYELTYTDLRDNLLPREPVELELSVIELDDGSGSLSMVCRTHPGGKTGVHEITDSGGWRTHLAGDPSSPVR